MDNETKEIARCMWMIFIIGIAIGTVIALFTLIVLMGESETTESISVGVNGLIAMGITLFAGILIIGLSDYKIVKRDKELSENAKKYIDRELRK